MGQIIGSGGIDDSLRAPLSAGVDDSRFARQSLLRFCASAGLAFCVVASVLLLMSRHGLDSAPARFSNDLLAVYAAAAFCLIGSLVGIRVAAYLSIASLALLTVFMRIAAGPVDLVLILTVVAFVLAGMHLQTISSRLAIVGPLVLAAGFLPRPAFVFGEAVQGPAFVLQSVPVIVGAFTMLAGELVIGSTHDVDRQRVRNDRLETGMRRLAQANVGFQSYSKSVGERSKQDERNRITREVHDSVGYALTNIAIVLDAATGLLDRDTERVRRLVTSGREQVDAAHWEVRRALHALRSLDSAETYGTKNVLRIAEHFTEATSVEVSLDLGNSRSSYGAHIDATLYRFVQEGLANAFRHGRATHIEVRLWESATDITLNIRDNGQGSKEVEEGIGFVGIRERLSQVDGRLDWESFENGFVLRCEIPLRSVAAQ